MAEVFFNNIVLVSFLLYFQAEAFYFLCYNHVIFFSKGLRVSKSNSVTSNLGTNITHSVYFLFLFFSLLSLKGSFTALTLLLLLSSVYLFKLNQVLEKIITTITSNNTIHLVLPTFSIFFFLFFFLKSFLTLFFFIELYGVLYYFCFLTSYSFTNQTLLKYKNGLLLLLWNNFLTTFFLAIACFLMTKNFGTTNFYELYYITTSTSYIYIFLIGLFWKLGLPLFHFFKLEVYKYLLRENVFLFSILTTAINVSILYLCVLQPVVFNTIYLQNFFIIFVMFAILLLIINLKLTNILYFFALSGVFTLTTVITVFLIKKCT